jgi:urate oxidase
MDTQPTGAVDSVLAAETYGKSRVRLMKLARRQDRHDLKEITLQILFKGDFANCYEAGDNSQVLPTDTIKNTVYVLARQNEIVAIEDFARCLIEHFLMHSPQVSEVRVEIVEHLWSRINSTAFTRASSQRTAIVTGTREGVTIHAGVDDLLVLRSAGSGFEGYIKDQHTTLPETKDRIFQTALLATWRYKTHELDFNAQWEGIRATILDTFATHPSHSVQHTLHAIGKQVLAAFPEVAEIHLTMPNKHALLVDLSRFGLDNPNEIFLPTDEPSGHIEAKLVRR